MANNVLTHIKLSPKVSNIRATTTYSNLRGNGINQTADLKLKNMPENRRVKFMQSVLGKNDV